MSDTTNTPEKTQEAPATSQAPAKSKKLIAMEEEMRELELQAARLSVLEKQANIEDIQERLAERQLRREAIRQKAYTNGATLKDTKQREEMVQRRCNHKKGGNGAAGVQLGQGDNPQHSVIKHTMLHGDMWVRCTRCGKTWKPPIKDDFNGDVEAYVKALTEYETAKNFQTNNSPSSSQQFQWSDGGAYAREVLRYTTLR